MKVLHLAKFYPPDHGGMESIVATLAEGAVARGWSADVLCTRRHWRTCVDAGPGEGLVVRAGQLGMLLSTPISPALVQETRRRVADADVVHVHLPNPMAALALLLAPRPRRMLLHWHSDVVTQSTARRLLGPLERWLLRRADLIVATSQAYLEASEQLAPFRAKATVVPLGIGDNAAEPVDAQRVRAWRARVPAGRIVLALGRMTGYKGFDVLIDAARELSEDVTVVIVGGGALLDSLTRRAAAATRGAKVWFTGPLSTVDRDALFAIADVFCLPSTSRAEAFGVALVEAMAAGKAVVASDIPGSGVGWVNACGLGVPPRDAPALAAALRRVLDDRTLAERMGRDARLRYMELFTAAAMNNRFDDLYRQLTVGLR
ncbi:MAG TPA: glycosyltransferase [Ideonella sp.]|uniref:glycosyltransferase n=1 Tax=Ideonella sp. TaxID=1929293 RepID=UPI002E371692|nr:glycosyltransferase [Ideonella sp.]HEX5686719.1 glycosyltransferase [Ideonella sp.]